MDSQRRVVSGMRPTGRLHLGHYHGVLKSWVRLQHEYECFFFVADWHAMTTEYEQPQALSTHVWDMLIDWLAAGINPGSATLFIQSKIPEQAELHLLLSMLTPQGWLERVPSYKDKKSSLHESESSTYGLLGYPLLQAADILTYRAGLVPVGADQVAHIEMARDLARRFNHLYGREAGFEDHARLALKKIGKKTGKLYKELRRDFLSHGNNDALLTAQALVREQVSLTLSDRERLIGYLEGVGRTILPEPHEMLTATAKMPGLDGEKMSSSGNNFIPLRAEPDEVSQKIRTMRTDPARVRLTDPGNPDVCPVWPFHQVYSDESLQQRVQGACRGGEWGCLECKQPVIDAIVAEQEPIRARAAQYENEPDLLRSLIADGTDNARDAARATLDEVREAMGLSYR
ncbi:tryptophan--tRNA ligase [Oceanobacter sp. 5_MG-2023]|uniref:tryptophan--tRNA ligase n=1 Tax=Oceanobacter sp. 5_MG-2023 TaxID=3062645 RepID=UPI0026E3FD2E|nr:tryptophan--tRNA ligase [Oceanobacter sp. 5_MG-2023]MDO6682999.1 tryptophan--tRNA ligase [Oceanobacter sp. 5_MG-2023]